MTLDIMRTKKSSFAAAAVLSLLLATPALAGGYDTDSSGSNGATANQDSYIAPNGEVRYGAFSSDSAAGDEQYTHADDGDQNSGHY
jgi:hypothetical protein